MRLGKLRRRLSVLALVALGCDATSTGKPNKNGGTDESAPVGNLPPTLSLLLDYNESMAGTTLEERYGLSGIDVSSYEESGASVTLGLSPTGSWSGEVIAYGITPPNCPAPLPGATSAPSCPGSERTEVEHYTFH